jgi:hypothetical protein
VSTDLANHGPYELVNLIATARGIMSSESSPWEHESFLGCSRGFARPLRLTRRASGGGEVVLELGAPYSARTGLSAGARQRPGASFAGIFRVAVPMRRRREDEAGSRELAELAALADGSLAPKRRAALEARVAADSELAERLAEQQRAVALARSAAAGVETPPALRARIETRQRARRAPVRRGLILAGAVVPVVLAIAIGLRVAGSGTSSERFHAALAPTQVVPGAGGEVTLTKTASGWRIELDATGLPRRQGALFYEAWLRSPAGVLVPIGTFNEGRNVTLWAGVSPKDYPSLTVTREQADGDQASSGEKVLVGTASPGG